MKLVPLLSAALLLLLFPARELTAQGELTLEASEGVVSIRADRVALSRLLAELDQAAGTQSEIPAALGTRSVSVSFRDLPLDAAIRQVFKGLALDYAVVGTQRIVVIGDAQAGGGGATAGSTFSVGAPATSTPQPLPGFSAPVPPSAEDEESEEEAPAGRGGRGGRGGAGRGGAGRGARGAQLQPGGLLNLPVLGQAAPAGVPFGPAGATPDAQATGPQIFGNTSPPILDFNSVPQGVPLPAPPPNPPPLPQGTSVPLPIPEQAPQPPGPTP